MKRILFIFLVLLVGCSTNNLGPVFLDDLDEAKLFDEAKANQRAVVIKAQGLDESAAKERARFLALDQVGRELLPPEIYNEQSEKIAKKLNARPQNYLIREEFTESRKLLSGLYGVSGSFLVDKAKIVQLFQKNLRILDQGHNAIVVLVSSPADEKLANVDFKADDLQTSMVSAVEAKLNGAGFKAVNFQNVLVSLRQSKQLQSKTNQLKPDELFELASGKGDRSEFYVKSMAHLKGMAKVIIRVQVLEVSFKNQTLAISANLSAVNISTPMGGTFASGREQVFWQGGVDAHPSAMMAAALGEMADKVERNFLPKVMSEMNAVDETPGKLTPYKVSLVGFDEDEVKDFTKALKESGDKKLMLGEKNLKQIDADPKLAELEIRYSGKASDFEGKIKAIAKDADLDLKDIELEELDLTLVED